MENLCERFRATGRDAHGGYAEFAVIPAAFAPHPEVFSDTEAAPLLCAGAIGFCSLRLAGIRDGDALGLTGFAHRRTWCSKWCGIASHAPGSLSLRAAQEQDFARDLGAFWAGDSASRPPEPGCRHRHHPCGGRSWRPGRAGGGRLVINAIRKETADQGVAETGLCGPPVAEKRSRRASNVTRRDVREFLQLAGEIPIKPEVQVYALKEANRALADLKERRIRGAKVLLID
jgi:propanol-preferring alcohol dehydrogenase